MGDLEFTNGFYKAWSRSISDQRCKNLFPVQLIRSARTQTALYGTEGVELLATAGNNMPNRGGITMNGIPYFVNGGVLYKLTRTATPDGDETFTMTELGTLAGTNVGRVSMSANGTQILALIPGGNGYIYAPADGTFALIDDPDFTANGRPMHSLFVDGYFIFTTDGRAWVHSDINDGTVYSALDFGTAESDPDQNVAPVKTKNQVFILGKYTSEGFANVGGSGFVFQRNNVFIDKGCRAPHSVVRFEDSFYMIGGGEKEAATILQFNGADGYNRIADDGIDGILAEYNDLNLATAFGFSYSARGSYFVGWTLPRHTIVFDLVSSKWHERTSILNNHEAPWRASCILEAYNRILVADTASGRIGVLSKDVFTEYDSNIIREFTTKPFDDGPMTIPTVEAVMEAGVGNSDCTEPVVEMRISRDGKTWNNWRRRSLGKVGEYKKRQVWRMNGYTSKMAVLGFRVSDPVKTVFIKLQAE